MTHLADLTSPEAWHLLAAGDRDVHLVDVRTRAEWTFVGVPDLAELGKRAVLVEWCDMFGRPNPQFLDELDEADIDPSATVLFLCRSGARSASAAELAGERFAATHNVADGFEGPLDDAAHRGTVAGWKAAGLPWRQG